MLKQGPEHHGVWNFVLNKLPELRMLNQNTFFSVTEINSNFKTNSACHVIFGDGTTAVTRDFEMQCYLLTAVFLTVSHRHVSLVTSRLFSPSSPQ